MASKIVLNVLDGAGRRFVLVKQSDREPGSERVLSIETPAGERIEAVVIGVQRNDGQHEVEAIHFADDNFDNLIGLLTSDGWAKSGTEINPIGD